MRNKVIKARDKLQQTHKYLLLHSTGYQQWQAWRQKSRKHDIAVGFYIIVLVVLLFSVMRPVSALSTWSQTDWSGGVGSSTSNQYSSAPNVDPTSSAGNLTLTANTPWYNTSWLYRRKITFDNTTTNLGTTSEALTNFPVLVKLTSSNFDFSKAQSAGQDIRFIDSNNSTVLNYQIEYWDSVGQTAAVWVSVPQVDSNSNTDNIYMYYGNNSASDGQSVHGVWDASYKAVYHLGETSGTSVTDSTSNSIGGTKVSSSAPSPNSNGQIGTGQTFDGSTAYTSNSRTNLSSGLTYEAWVKTTDTRSNTGATIVANTVVGDSTGSVYEMFGVNGGKASYNQYVSDWTHPLQSTTSVNDGNWHYIAVTHNSSTNTADVYVDGNLEATATKTYQTGFNAWDEIGASYTRENKFNGSIDEVRISSTPRDSAWIAASYKNEAGSYSSYGPEQQQYSANGTLTSAIFDSSTIEDWGTLSYTATAPANTTVSVKVRSGNAADLSDASAFSSCSAVSSGSDMTSACVPNQTRYVQYQITMTNTAASTPTFQDISLGYTPSDSTPPTTNASSLIMKNSSGGSTISSNGWTNASTPYFSWTAGADNVGGIGLKGYCLYLGSDNTADPVTTKGLLGTSPVDTSGACQFAVAGTSVDLSTAGYIGTALTSSNSPYYLLVKAIDGANNVYAGSSAQFQFRFDNTPPLNPTFITAPSQFVASKDVTLTWPTSGSDAASDGNSGLAGLQYRIGSSGTWYGDNHNGNQNASDLLTNDGSYETVSTPDFSNLSDGNNIIYFRTWDAAGNISTAYVTTVIKINTSSPSSPQNVTATPSTNTTNSFAFSWLAPATFTGSAGNITYCYTINALPSSSNCTYTAGGVTSLSAGAYATQPGDNTFYVVAKDEAGNINYATQASTTFTANTSAPGMPLNADVADISVKSTQNWKLTVSWEAPTNTGAGVASYKVFRSTDNSSFSQVASTSGTSYVDTGLDQVTYYYKVKACDSANNCGAFTPVVSKLPTGKFTDPANLIANPSVTVSTKTAQFNWATDRTSDSRVEYGLSSGVYFSTEAAQSDQVKSHSLELNNLTPGTTYFYKAQWADEDGNLGSSSELEFTTLPAPTVSDVSPIDVNVSSATIKFSTLGADAIKIYYGKTKGFGGLVTINTSTSASNYTVPLDGLDDGAQYFFKINPIDADGNEYDDPITFSFNTPARPHISNLKFQPVANQPTSTQLITWSTNVPATTQLSFGPVGQGKADQIDTKLTTDHQMQVTNLLDNTSYSLFASSQDGSGNTATSDEQIFKTALDTRPPKISDITTETSIKGNGAEGRGQIIVAWKTDEASTSQVAYSQGSNGAYNNKTSQDSQLTFDHVVIVSDLPPSSVYHFQPLSKDKAGNLAKGQDQSAIVGQATDNVLTIILNSLQKVFGL